MADRIIVDFQALDRISDRLNAAGRELDQAMSQLACLRVTRDVGADVRISGCGTSLQLTGMTVNAETVSAAVSSYKSAVEKVSWYASKFGSAVQDVSDLFETTEQNLSEKKLDTGEATPGSEGMEDEGSDSSWGDFFLDYFKKAIGKAGILGTIASAAWSSSSSKSVFEGLATYLSKTGPAYVKWAKGVNNDEFARSIIGLQKFLKKPATEGTKWARMTTDFNAGLAKGLTSGPTWIAAAVSSAFKNYSEYANGDISADRAVVEGVVETGGTVLLGATVAAGVAAVIPAAPIVAVGVISTLIICAGDKLVSHFTGKGIVESAGSFVGDIYDSLKQTFKSTKATVVNGWNAFSQSVSNVFRQPLPAGGGTW
jgi:hypothetical protein